jgi:uncharacterized membrane protein YedE/YeeE
MKRGVHTLVPLGTGLLFGVGLVVSGMAQPRKVLGFLDVFGAWDPSLMLVMAGAIAVYAGGRYVVSRGRPELVAKASGAAAARVDKRLVLGSALFGVGWGLSGYCPGPSIVSLASGALPVLVFVAMFCVGSLLGARSEALTKPSGDVEPEATVRSQGAAR